MDRTRVVAYTAAVLFVLCLAAPACAEFIGTGVAFDKHFGDTINVNVGTGVSALDNTAFGLADMNIGVTWGLDLGLGTMAGYPYGYGGVGAVSTGGLGYSLGMTMDETHGAGFDGAGFGLPFAEQGVTTTHFDQLWGNTLQLDNSQAVLPFSGFPVL
jgi:hypothetical protein